MKAERYNTPHDEHLVLFIFCLYNPFRLLFAQAYFSTVLDQHREVWDGSDAVKCFFFPGPPTSYSKALARRRSIEINEVRNIKHHIAVFRGSYQAFEAKVYNFAFGAYLSSASFYVVGATIEQTC